MQVSRSHCSSVIQCHKQILDNLIRFQYRLVLRLLSILATEKNFFQCMVEFVIFLNQRFPRYDIPTRTI